jgi:hypothetical protein
LMEKGSHYTYLGLHVNKSVCHIFENSQISKALMDDIVNTSYLYC